VIYAFDQGGVEHGKPKTQVVQGKDRQEKVPVEIVTAGLGKLPAVSYIEGTPHCLQRMWILCRERSNKGS